MNKNPEISETSDLNANNKLSDKQFKQQAKLKYIEQIPKLSWLIFVIIIVIIFTPSIKELLTKVNKFKGYGVEIELKSAFDLYNENKESEKKTKDSFGYIEITQQEQITNRVKLLQPILQSKKFKILWVDDHPVNNVYVSKILEQIGFKIETASSSKAGIELYNSTLEDSTLGKYDLIISDYGKDDKLDLDGLQFAASIKQLETVPVVIYSSSYFQNGLEKPDYIFAIANRPDFLINYILDITERGETPYP